MGRSCGRGNCEPVSLQPSQVTSNSRARSKRQERNAVPRCLAPPIRTPVSTHESKTHRRVTSSSSPASSNRQRVKVTPSSSVPHQSRSEEHTSELQSRQYLVCRLLLEKKKKKSEK